MSSYQSRMGTVLSDEVPQRMRFFSLDGDRISSTRTVGLLQVRTTLPGYRTKLRSATFTSDATSCATTRGVMKAQALRRCCFV